MATCNPSPHITRASRVYTYCVPSHAPLVNSECMHGAGKGCCFACVAHLISCFRQLPAGTDWACDFYASSGRARFRNHLGQRSCRLAVRCGHRLCALPDALHADIADCFLQTAAAPGVQSPGRYLHHRPCTCPLRECTPARSVR